MIVTIYALTGVLHAQSPKPRPIQVLFPGHNGDDARVWSNPSFHRLIRNAIRWSTHAR